MREFLHTIKDVAVVLLFGAAFLAAVVIVFLVNTYRWGCGA